MQRVLITGVTGFLGKQLALKFLRAGYEVIGCGRGSAPAIDGGTGGAFTYHPCDWSDNASLAALTNGTTIVIHAAGLVHQFNRSVRDEEFHEVNAMYSDRLAEAAIESGVAHFIYISSVSVYGDQAHDSSSDVDLPPRSESWEPNPTSAYGRSKLEAERLLIDRFATSSSRLSILRPVTLYGEGDPGNVARLFQMFSKLPCWLRIGDESNRKSLLHVHDAAQCITQYACEASPSGEPEIFNIADRPASMREINDAIASATATPVLPFSIPVRALRALPIAKLRRILTKWTADDAYSGEALQASLTPRPSFVDLRVGLRKQAQWMKRHGLIQRGQLIKRLFDLVVGIVLLIVFAVPMIGVAMAVALTSRGPIMHVSRRIGTERREFRMYKFRTMRIDTPQVATHLLTDPDRFLTPIGNLLRKTSLDELPQLINVIRGDMSLVGPRPALFNQDDLIELRCQHGIGWLQPGVTGWAQVLGRDELSIPDKVALDVEYADRRSWRFDCYVLWKTVAAVLLQRGFVRSEAKSQMPPSK